MYIADGGVRYSFNSLIYAMKLDIHSLPIIREPRSTKRVALINSIIARNDADRPPCATPIICWPPIQLFVSQYLLTEMIFPTCHVIS